MCLGSECESKADASGLSRERHFQTEVLKPNEEQYGSPAQGSASFRLIWACILHAANASSRSLQRQMC